MRRGREEDWQASEEREQNNTLGKSHIGNEMKSEVLYEAEDK